MQQRTSIRTERRSHAREQTRGEEIANSISHGAGLGAAIVGAPLLIMHAARQGDAGYLVGCIVFAATMIMLYLSSTLYHSFHPGRLKHIFRIIDHSAVYLLIAGTYTPFTLGVLYGAWGWTLLVLIWVLALTGVALKVLRRMTHPIISTILYLLMGWLIIVAIDPLYQRLPAAGLFWLVAGGLAYTLGTIFFVSDSRLRYGHFIWHWFVLAGTTCHYFAVYWYAA
ncbi:MAG: hemolysin III family protein [Nitrosomonadales bacterium]|nr:hemolysin III family protein [Nitrosomonadales bacterium]